MFTREDTRAMKGFAVILMLFHHLAAFSQRWPVGFEGFKSPVRSFVEDGYLTAFAISAKLCVPMFFFLGGYGLYKRRQSGKFSFLDSTISLYKKYWKVFVIFVPVALIFFARSGAGINELCTRYVFDTKKDMVTAIVSNLTGYSSSLNSEWWFLSTYICVTLSGCLFCEAIKKHDSFLKDMFLVFVADILIRNIFPGLAAMEAFQSLGSNFFYKNFFSMLNYASAFFCGIVFAKHDGLVKIKNRVDQTGFGGLLCVAGCFVVFWSRVFVASDALDILYMPLLSAFLSGFADRVASVRKVFAFLGRHSLNIWLIHTFYCYYFLEVTKIVYYTQNVWIDLLVLLLLSLASSLVLEFFYTYLGKAWGKIKERIQKKDIEEIQGLTETQE